MKKKISSSFKKIKKDFNSEKKGNNNFFAMHKLIIISIIIFGLGLLVGGIIMYHKSAFKGNSTLFNELISAYDEIVESYYQEVDKDKLLEASISGMIRYLGDPYSTYMSKDVAEDFTEDIEGTYQGIGAEIKYNKDKLPSLGRIFENSPAEKAGLKENDVIYKVNDIDVTKYDLSKIASIVKGDKDTNVVITVKRDKEELTFTITRGVVDYVSVTSEIINKKDTKIGYLYISTFANNTYNQFKKELTNLEKENIDSLIIDVRGNTGGYLSTVQDIISLFVEKGKPIYQLKTKGKVEIINDTTDEKRDYKIVVLADRASASASELLVGALKESYGATIVGTKTFGKGKVQKVSTLSSGAMFKYTYQEWLTPDGNYIDKQGIEPDENIEYVYDKNGKDNQKDKAIEIITKK